MNALPITTRRATRRPVPLAPYVRGASPRSVVTAPLIYSLTLPLALLDLFVTVYQRICFPV